MGQSDAPGDYLILGCAFAVAAVVLFFVSRSYPTGSWHWWALLCGVTALAMLAYIPVAMTDGYGNKCESCGVEHPARPWSR